MDFQSNDENRNRNFDLYWWLQHVLVPISLAVIAGTVALEVVDRQIAGDHEAIRLEQSNQGGSGFNPVESTLPPKPPTITVTANAPPPTPEATSDVPAATAVPTAILPANQPFQETCGQAPPGWVVYLVKPGDTLFSLARWTGTTVAAIRNVNCLYGTLKAYEQIRLPFQPETTDPVSRATVTITATPTATLTPTSSPSPSPTWTPTSTWTPTPTPTNVPPVEVLIVSPADGSQFVADQRSDKYSYRNLALQGTAVDLEDGDLDGASLVWTTNRKDIQNAFLGAGSNIVAAIYTTDCRGTWHEITLTATDSRGGVTTAVTTVFVIPHC